MHSLELRALLPKVAGEASHVVARPVAGLSPGQEEALPCRGLVADWKMRFGWQLLEKAERGPGRGY